MSTRILGVKPPDGKWKLMKAVWDACHEAGVEVPIDVNLFFGGEEPDEMGVVLELKEHVCCQAYGGEMEDGFQIDVSKLPKDVKWIRFYNSF